MLKVKYVSGCVLKQEQNCPAPQGKRLSISPFVPLERFLLQPALLTLPSGSRGKNLAHFLSNMSSSCCSSWSLAVFCSLLQHLPFKITFYFHLVSRPPLCSQLPWRVFHNPCFCQKGKTRGEGFQLGTEPAHPHEPGWRSRWPLNSQKSPQAAAQALEQGPCWRTTCIFPVHLCKPAWGLATSQRWRASSGASLEHSREEVSDLFCQEFGTVSFKPEDFPTSQHINKLHL